MNLPRVVWIICDNRSRDGQSTTCCEPKLNELFSPQRFPVLDRLPRGTGDPKDLLGESDCIQNLKKSLSRPNVSLGTRQSSGRLHQTARTASKLRRPLGPSNRKHPTFRHSKVAVAAAGKSLRCNSYVVYFVIARQDCRHSLSVNVTRLSNDKDAGCVPRQIGAISCKSLDWIHRTMSDFSIHLTADILGEADAMLSRMRSTGRAGANQACTPENSSARQTRRQQMNGRLRIHRAVPVKSNPHFHKSVIY